MVAREVPGCRGAAWLDGVAMTLRALVSDLVTWWKRRQALRQAPSPAELERRRAHLAQLTKHHRERATHLRALQNAVTRRLAAELGVRNPTRRTL